ncbi:uncharacterized protein FIESC28_03824 [Fusarium coffeatum]|uniref:Heterokaryon incompatibility domain-containing protein n=1 Tax=Fusarium coffeatum TaxID=231269 RepID=A0A366S3B0_9HYPO|nr:uncharacterized protein FIESC28_03824 [Fusarium coffeatum]RBR23348.1 hypothetical protein FIESC28_03824 [Fusarium coffeatum]
MMDYPLEYKTFEYDALPSPTSIRLLYPVTRPKNHKTPSINSIPPLEFHLKSTERHDLPSYDALSYTWGNPNFVPSGAPDEYSTQHKHVIVVNGRLFYITRNLYEALCQLRQPKQGFADVDRRSEPFNKTGLIKAAEKGSLKRVIEYLEQGADHTYSDSFGETALHYAAENGFPEIVRVLLSKGADMNILDRSGRNPLSCCLQRERHQWQETAEILQNWNSRNSSPVEETTGAEVPLWIDAICINQDDISERNSQVAIMSHIYGSARCVVAWLGEADEQTESFYNSFSCLLQPAMLPTQEYLHFISGRGCTTPWDMDGMRELLTRTWFSRTWVIQEVSLAKDIILVCGPFRFPWDEVFTLLFENLGEAKAYEYLSQGKPRMKFERASPGTEILSLFDIRIRTRPDCIEGIRARKKFLKQPALQAKYKQQLSLAALIILTWNFYVSDPRDKIFALLSLSKPLDGISVDYSKSIPDVFTDAGRVLLQAGGDNSVHTWDGSAMDDLEPLESLSFVQPHISTTLPSWVPTFNQRLDRPRIYHKRYKAAGHHQLVLYESLSCILKLDALIVDTVVEIEKSPPPNWQDPLVNAHTMEAWWGIISRLPSTYPTGNTRIEAFWRTLVSHLGPRNMTPTSQAFFKGLLRQCLVEHRRSSSSDRHSKLCQAIEDLRVTDTSDLLPTASEVLSSEKGLYDRTSGRSLGVRYLLRFKEFLRERCLARTEGGYLGLLSKETRVEDRIVILAGGRTPFVLRPNNTGQFTFVGEAFVHGMMFGELVKGKEYHFQPLEIR